MSLLLRAHRSRVHVYLTSWRYGAQPANTDLLPKEGERKKNSMAIGVTGGQSTFHWSPRLLANQIVREVAPRANNFFTAQNTRWCQARQYVIPKATFIWTFVNKVNWHRKWHQRDAQRVLCELSKHTDTPYPAVTLMCWSQNIYYKRRKYLRTTEAIIRL